MQELHTDRKVDRERFILRTQSNFLLILFSNKQYIVSIQMLKPIMAVQSLA